MLNNLGLINMRKHLLYLIPVIIVLIGFYFYANMTVQIDPLLLEQGNKYFDSYKEKLSNDKIIIIDYRIPVFRKRLWIFDISQDKIILNDHVSHAWKSGVLIPSDFSNDSGTNKSCYGIFITQESYWGKFGYSMRIDGLQKGINHNARNRAIVFHEHYSPFSDGCFMTFPETNKKLIDLTKNGSLVFVNK